MVCDECKVSFKARSPWGILLSSPLDMKCEPFRQEVSVTSKVCGPLFLKLKFFLPVDA